MRFNKVIFTLAFLFLGKAIYAQISTSKELYSLSSERSSELECYCHFNSDFTNFMNQYAALNAASNRWLAERENAFKNEINNRLGTNYSDFRQAQKEFFKQYRDVKINATGAYNHIKSQLDNKLETNLFEAQKENASYQIYNFQKINIESINSGKSPRFNLGQLFDKKTGKYVRDMSLNDFKSKMSSHDQNYINNKKKYNSTKDEIKYFDKSIKNSKRLEGYISDRYISHYNSYRDYLKRVQLMQTYLILDYWYKSNPSGLISPPNYLDYPDPYYSGGPEDYYDILKRWNTEAPKTTNDIISLNITEAKTQFAINNFSSSAANDFIEDNKGYKEYLQRYWVANGYNYQSLKYAEYFLKSFQGGDYTNFEEELAGRSHLYISASETEYQTRSNPEVIITTELSLSAIHAYALNGINHLLYGFSTIDSYNRNEWEGIHMRVILHSNDIPNISQFTSRELGKLFDFHSSYSENIKIGFADNLLIENFSHRDNEYGKDLFIDPFKIEALKTLANGGSVNFNSEILKSKDFIGTKTDCVLEHLLNSNNILKKVINAFTNNNSKYRLKFITYYGANDDAIARTSLPDENNIITIKFNTTQAPTMNAIDLAGTIIHEVIHAELHRIKYTQNQPPNALPKDKYNWFIKMWEYFALEPTEEEKATAAEHNYMANSFVDPIAEGLREFDNFSHPLSHYKGWAWEGLEYYGIQNGYITDKEYKRYLDLSKIVENDKNKNPCD